MSASSDSSIPPPSQRTAGALLLLADDYADARELYRVYLELIGYEVVTAADGQEAVEQARLRRPAVILLDIRMPRMSGIEAMQELKADPRFAGVPIVALTAHAYHTERDMFLAQGFDAVVPKPCLPEDLAQTVEGLLASRTVPANAP